jgi:hypothetical protein
VTYVAAFLLLGVVVAIAAWLVAREAGRLARTPPPALFDPEDAFEWIVEHLPDDVAATLTIDDVRRILELQIEYFEGHGVSPNGHVGGPTGPAVVGGGEQIEYILVRSEQTSEGYLPEQIEAVVNTQLHRHRNPAGTGPSRESGWCSQPR